MKKTPKKTTTKKSDSLRARAEQLLKKQTELTEELSKLDMQHLIQELSTH